MKSQYLCIDLKSFYASVECVERGLDPMTTNLVVADPDRSKGTICLAISPAMKKLGVKNRCRIYEIPPKIKHIVAPPRMQKYIEYSAEIYGVYLSFVSVDDIHVYSIDEAFIDVTKYLAYYKMTARELAVKIMQTIYDKVGVRATCGIGTNLYLAKIALDIKAKRASDFIGELDEETFCKEMWTHKPLTDFWRIGPGIERRLQSHGIFTIGDIVCAPEKSMYKWFGIDAELIIDHAWGKEPVSIADIKAYKSKTSSISSGQVLMRDYFCEEGLLIVKEMMDLLCLELVSKNLITDSLGLYIGYSHGCNIPSSRGTAKIETRTNADFMMIRAVADLYKRIVRKDCPIRRIGISCNNVVEDNGVRQLSLFDYCPDDLERAYNLQTAIVSLKTRFGKNSVLKGMNYDKAGTTRERNQQIGGHKSG